MKGGPQKWRWFLNDEGLLASESKASLDATPIIVEESPRLQEESIPIVPTIVPTIESALRWLESSQNYHLPALQFSLERAQKKLHVMDEMVQYHQSLVARPKRPLTKTLARDQPPKSSFDTFQTVWMAHCGVVEKVTQYYGLVGCPKEEMGSNPLQILPSLLLEDISVVWSVDRIQLLRLDLTELVSFLQCRRLFANPLLVRVTDTEDTSRLEEWELSLQKLLEETTKQCVALPLQPTVSPSDLLEQRLQPSKDQLTEAKQRQQSAKHAFEMKHNELEAVQRHVILVKTQLEKEITVLLQLDSDDSICIQLNINSK
jgi:hypothetical protein